MLDKFGQLVRNIRITRSLLLGDMAKTLGISPSELSAIECGRKPIPDWFILELEEKYHIGNACVSTLGLWAKERSDQCLDTKDSRNKKNSEGYSDPTAYAALKNIQRQEDRYYKLRKVILNICDVADFEIRGPIVLIDKRTGKVWR